MEATWPYVYINEGSLDYCAFTTNTTFDHLSKCFDYWLFLCHWDIVMKHQKRAALIRS